MTTSVADPVRLGLVVPGDCHVDDEFWTLVAPEAIPYVTRTYGASAVEMARDGVDEVRGLAEGPEIAMAAERLRDVSPMAACYVDTSISFVRGVGGDTEIAGRLEATLRCPAIVTATAVAAALRALGARRISVLSAYAPGVDERLVAYYAGHEIEVRAIHRLSRSYVSGADSLELGRMSPDELVADAAAVADDDVDALFIPCTAVRTIGAIERLEQALGTPVVTSIQATMWAVLRLAGLSVARRGYGALFDVPAVPDPFRTTVDAHA